MDRIVAERPDAADEPAEFVARMTQVLAHELGMLLRRTPPKDWPRGWPATGDWGEPAPRRRLRNAWRLR